MQIAAIACLVIGAATLAACTTTDTKRATQFYDVKGSTPQAIDRQMRKLGPMRGHAIATAEIKFEVVEGKLVERTAPDGRKTCVADRIDIRVVANITLPRWMERQNADAGLRRAFDNMAAYAKAHEDVHVRIAEEAVTLMETLIKLIPPQKSCKAYEREVDKVVDAVKKLHNKAQLQFDAAEQKRLKKLFADAEAKARSGS
jgi:predicted secreted Zn-dependent protease